LWAIGSGTVFHQFKVARTERRAYIAALLSLATDIRSGEIRALRRADTEGLKRPKNGEPRRVPQGIEIGDRRIDFHSFRHIFAGRMANRMAADKVAKVTGHRSKAAAKIYQDHVTARILSEAGVEAAQEFENIMEFAKRGA
jgi:integrase